MAKFKTISKNKLLLDGLWANLNTFNFISNLSFDGYILAGHSVTNMINQTRIKGDLDFWVNDSTKYVKAFEEMYPYYKNFSIYPSMIEMFNDDDYDSKTNLPKINLINSNSNPCETINRFDFDYCRCYWTPESGIVFGFGCKECIETKIIKYPTSHVNNKRIIKAINYGYTFTKGFWFERNHLVVGKKSNIKLEKGKLFEPYQLDIGELDECKFEKSTDQIKITDYVNIEGSINEIYNYFESKKNLIRNRTIPVLIQISNGTIKSSNIESNKKIILEYIKNIILLNPLTSSNYLEFQIGKHFINLKNNNICPDDSLKITIPEINYEDDEIEELEEIEEDDSVITINPNYLSTNIIKLNESGSAYLTIDFLSDDDKKYLQDNFDSMWALHPETKHKIIMYEKEVDVFRYSKSYLKTPTDLDITKTHSYMYSGFDTSDNNSALPEHFAYIYNHMLNQDSKYNQVIANWYEDSNDYIAPHADCTKCMIPDAKISIVSIYPTENPSSYRYLTIVPKLDKYSSSSIKKIRLDHGLIITMCGTTQKEFLHSVDKVNHPVSKRISLSFRQMI